MRRRISYECFGMYKQPVAELGPLAATFIFFRLPATSIGRLTIGYRYRGPDYLARQPSKMHTRPIVFFWDCTWGL